MIDLNSLGEFTMFPQSGSRRQWPMIHLGPRHTTTTLLALVRIIVLLSISPGIMAEMQPCPRRSTPDTSALTAARTFIFSNISSVQLPRLLASFGNVCFKFMTPNGVDTSVSDNLVIVSDDFFMRSDDSRAWVIGTCNFSREALLVRGGGNAKYSPGRVLTTLGIFPQSSRKYAKTLEGQLASMDQQLRQSLQELTNLKSQMANRAATRQKYRKGKMEPNAASALKEQVEALENQVKDLRTMKQNLESMLSERRLYIQSLEEQLNTQQRLTEQTKESYQKELEVLNQELESKTQHQWHTLQDLMKGRIARAAASAHEAVVSTLDERVQGAAQSVRKDTLEKLEQERQRSVNAVAKQRTKMRALAKALAVREKKLHSLELQREVKSNLERKRLQQQAKEEQFKREKQELLAKMEEAKDIQIALELDQRQKEEAAADEAERLAAEAKRNGASTGSDTDINTDMKVHKAECWQRHVLWQPLTLPPSSVMKISFLDP